MDIEESAERILSEIDRQGRDFSLDQWAAFLEFLCDGTDCRYQAALEDLKRLHKDG